MPLPLMPIVIASLIAGAYHQSTKKPPPLRGKVTPERALIFETALNELKDPEKLKKLAEVYKKEGLDAHAELLEKRAKLRELPPEVKSARRDAFKKAMASTDPVKVKYLAEAFEKEGATGAASSLREYAESLDKAPKTAVPAAPAVIVPTEKEKAI